MIKKNNKRIYCLPDICYKKFTKSDVVGYLMILFGVIAGISVLLAFILKIIIMGIVSGIGIALEYGCAIYLFYGDKKK